MKLCAKHRVQLDIEIKSMGGVTCQGGMMAGSYLFIQNTRKFTGMSLCEFSAFGYEF